MLSFITVPTLLAIISQTSNIDSATIDRQPIPIFNIGTNQLAIDEFPETANILNLDRLAQENEEIYNNESETESDDTDTEIDSDYDEYGGSGDEIDVQYSPYSRYGPGAVGYYTVNSGNSGAETNENVNNVGDDGEESDYDFDIE